MCSKVLWFSRKIRLDSVGRVMTQRCGDVCIDAARFMQRVILDR